MWHSEALEVWVVTERVQRGGEGLRLLRSREVEGVEVVDLD